MVRVWDPEEYAWAPSLFQIRKASRVLLTDYGGDLPVPEGAFYVDCIVQEGRVAGRINPEPPHGWDPFTVMSRDHPAVSLW